MGLAHRRDSCSKITRAYHRARQRPRNETGGTLESVNSDWDFDPRTTRSIHVNSRYMLWVMEKVDGADHLIEEMELVE